MRNKILLLIPAGLLCLLSFRAMAETPTDIIWTGPSTATLGDIQTFTFTNGTTYPGLEWHIGKGLIVSYSLSGTVYTVTVQWTETGTGVLQLLYDEDIVISNFTAKNVTVTGSLPATPSPTFIVLRTQCGRTVIQRNSGPASGYTWAWQTSPTGTTTYLGVADTVVLTTVGTTTLYLRSNLDNSPLWSTPQTAGTFTVVVPPAAPATSTDGHVIANATTSIPVSVAAVSGATSYRWYHEATGGTGIATTSTPSYSPSLSGSQQYYVESRMGECASATRKAVNAYRHPEPVISSSDASVNMNSTATISVSNYAYDSYQWLDSAGNPVVGAPNSSSFTTHMKGKYKVRATKQSASPFVTSLFTIGSGFQGLNMNYIVSNAILKEGVTSLAVVDTLGIKSKSQTIQYMDGLGAPMQSVVTQGSPLKKDIIQPVVYDNFGREYRKYLPVTVNKNSGWYKPNTINSRGAYSSIAENFYQANPGANIAQDTVPYSETIFEPSPANRPIKEFGAGSSWTVANKGIQYAYRLNIHSTASSDSAEKVIAWKIASGLPARQSAATGFIAANGYYANSQLTIKVIKDEQGNRVREYTNKQGQVILKKVQAVVADSINLNSPNGWASTYYIYDQVGNLRFVLPPELSKIAHSSDTAAMNNTRLNNWAFKYTYDSRKRMTTKQVPGAGPVYMVYDSRDRLVLTQDANQRSGTNKYWSFTKYDEFNRPILTGIKDTAATVSQADMQTVVNTHYAKAWTRLYETYMGTASGNMHGYSNKSYPVVTGPTTTNDKNRYLSVTYYDNYNFKNVLYDSSKYSFSGSHLTGQESAFFKRVTGQVTGTKIKVLDGGVTGGNTWLVSVNYYDDDYRMVQNVSANYKGGIDRITNTYDFTGKVLKSKATHAENDVLWKDLSGVVMNGNMLKRTKASTGWDAGAVSTHTLPASTDGWIEVIVGETTTNRVLGFANNSTDNDYVQIDYAFYLNGSSLKIYETSASTNAALKYTAPTALVPGEVLRIQRTGTSVQYKRNGVVIYPTSTPNLASSGALLVDISMFANGGAVTGVSASFEGSQHSVTRSFEYDHAGRVLEVWHRLDSEDSVLLVKNSYNELGQLVDKKLHSTDGGSFKQSVDYAYNIRGWLTKVNESDLSSEDADAGRDLFGMQLLYNETETDVSSSPLYNGNISAIKWSNNLALGDVVQNAYAYSYDPMNRITASAYKEKKPTWTAATNYGNAETGFTYDLNGNIKTLQRNDRRSSGWMDNLTYDYGTTASNKLLKVSDSGDKTKGFLDGASSTSDDYAYDSNGNLVWDRNKGGTEMLANGSFDSGNASWTLTNSGRMTFTNGEVQLASGSPSAVLTQTVVTQGKPHVVVLDIEVTAGTLTVYVGGATSSFTTTGQHIVPITAGTSSNEFRLTAGTTFVGKVKSVSLKGVTVITYNFMNLPELVTRAGDKQLQYIYDASGRKLRQEVSTSSVLNKSTDYNGEYIYENDTLQFINHEEGRLIPGPVPGSPEYQYHLKDHLGNVRMTFTSKPQIDTVTATMETANISDEEGEFLYYDEAVKINSAIFDHTDTGATHYSLRLTGKPGHQYGLAKSLSVMAGDTINATVFAKYLEKDTTAWNNANGLATLMNTVRWGTPGTGVLIDGGLTGSTGGATPPFGSLLAKGSGTESGAPKAYLNYLLFDRDYNFLDGGFVPVTTDAREYGQNGAHEELNKQISITQAGYVYLYLSNDNAALGGNAVEVFFDDFEVEHIKSPVVQQDDYYAFGLTYNSYQRENSEANKWKFQGQEHVTDLDLGWDSFKWRNHMPDIGRFFNVDPLANDYVYNSPYAFSENSVVKYVELEGLEAQNPQSGNTKKQEESQGSNEPNIFVNAIVSFFNGMAELGGNINRVTGQESDDYDQNLVTAANTIGELPLIVQGHFELLQPSGGSNIVNKVDDVKTVADDVAKKGKELSPKVEGVISTMKQIESEGGSIVKNKLSDTQEINMTIKDKTGSGLNLRVETHTVPQKYGGNGKTPQRHMNVEPIKSNGKKAQNNYPAGGHVILE
jgi:RHS repeat-associated protein